MRETGVRGGCRSRRMPQSTRYVARALLPASTSSCRTQRGQECPRHIQELCPRSSAAEDDSAVVGCKVWPYGAKEVCLEVNYTCHLIRVFCGARPVSAAEC